jgi:hypothetical protein
LQETMLEAQLQPAIKLKNTDQHKITLVRSSIPLTYPTSVTSRRYIEQECVKGSNCGVRMPTMGQ